jgi:hypothetical protein
VIFAVHGVGASSHNVLRKHIKRREMYGQQKPDTFFSQPCYKFPFQIPKAFYSIILNVIDCHYKTQKKQIIDGHPITNS